jgi:hypothetical protein
LPGHDWGQYANSKTREYYPVIKQGSNEEAKTS